MEHNTHSEKIGQKIVAVHNIYAGSTRMQRLFREGRDDAYLRYGLLS
jgi:hypothetical protein